MIGKRTRKNNIIVKKNEKDKIDWEKKMRSKNLITKKNKVIEKENKKLEND